MKIILEIPDDLEPFLENKYSKQNYEKQYRCLLQIKKSSLSKMDMFKYKLTSYGTNFYISLFSKLNKVEKNELNR